MKLLRSQRNQIFDWIIDAGLSPSQLKLSENDSISTVKLSLKDSNFYFQFTLHKHAENLYINRVRYSPAKNTDLYSTGQLLMAQFQDLKKFIVDWASYLSRELDQPDKWQQFVESSKQISIKTDEKDNQQFTIEEFRQIEIAVEQVRIRSNQIGLAEDQLKLLHEKLDYISEKAKTLGKLDWKNLFVGSMVGVVIQMAIPPDTTQLLWKIIGEAFNQFFLLLAR
jgi:hypothetical protein